VLYSIRSERLFLEQLDYNLLFRWFVGLGMDEDVWDLTTFSKSCERLFNTALVPEFFCRIHEEAQEHRLLSDEHFTLDKIRDGVEKQTLATTLELALAKAGLIALPQGQYDGTVPTISLQVSDIKEPNGRFYAIDVVLSCLDNVYDNRTAGPFSAAIWSKDVLQLLGVIDLSRVVKGEKTLIDMFLADYVEASSQ
jgi:hypothetical protein